MESMTFISACRKFFGLKPGQGLQDFAAEIRSLSPEDRAALVEMFRTVDIDATKTS